MIWLLLLLVVGCLFLFVVLLVGLDCLFRFEVGWVVCCWLGWRGWWLVVLYLFGARLCVYFVFFCMCVYYMVLGGF